MIDDETTDIEHFAAALRAAGQFVYHNSNRLVLVSLAWFVLSLPVVTLGVTTLGVYVAVSQLRSDRNRLERGPLFGRVRKQAVPATLFGLFPLVLYAFSVLYLIAPETSTLQTVLFFVTLYGALYATLIMIPAFDALAAGESPKSALLDGVRWTAAHPTLSLLSLVISAVLFVGTILLTIAFPLVFAGLAVSFNVFIISTEDWTDTGQSEENHQSNADEYVRGITNRHIDE